MNRDLSERLGYGQFVRTRAERELDSKLRAILALLLNLATILKVGWGRHPPVLTTEILHWTQVGLLAVYAVSLFVSARFLITRADHRKEFLEVTRPEQLIVILGLVSAGWPEGVKFASAMLLMFQMTRLYLKLTQTKVPAGLLFLGSFIALIAVGTAALMLPAATPADRPISLIDAMFTITSAISQTGLVVRPTGEGFTRLGQVIILIWIQVGALGVIVFGALLVGVIGRSFSLKATQTMSEGTEQGWSGQLSLQRLVSFIIVFTHLVELAGAVFLYFGWPETWPGAPPGIEVPSERFYHAMFFSVSAFCNAGFATTDNSLSGLRVHWSCHLVIVPLIVLGSIGFPVLDNMRRVAWARLRGIRHEGGKLVRLNLNSKIVLAATAWVYAIGLFMIALSELLHQSGTPLQIMLDAHFMNVNRTSGFATIEPRNMGELGRLSLIVLMFIGGSPGSVAGGIKVMVLAVMVMTVWSTIRGKSETTMFGRTIPQEVVRKSATLIVLFLLCQLAVMGSMAVTERERFPLEELLFEATSALGTCGLSAGVTESPLLSTGGKITMTIAMFVGRVGPFAVMAALLSIARRHRTRVEYPTEDVVIY